jgi:nicotinate-nucleotide adenylyltransferase
LPFSFCACRKNNSPWRQGRFCTQDFIALYGGSYNLPTETHRNVGITVRDQIKPDAVWYQVSPQNPHKSTKGMASFIDRVAMAELNIIGEPKLAVSVIEQEISKRIGTTESAAILKDMIEHHPETRFAWVLGADCFADLHTWKNYGYILEHVPLVVVPRKGWTEKALNSVAARHPASHRVQDSAVLRTENGWFLLDFPEDGVNATNAREEIKHGIQPATVRPEVYHYARQPGIFL